MDYDVIIIGGRIAGSLLAALLGRRDFRVLVLERSSFPSDTLSTHFFRAPALRAFQQVGADQEVLDAAPRLTVNYNVVDGLVFPEAVDRPHDFPFYMCVRRITLDEILVRRARQEATVEYREKSRVEGLLREHQGVTGAAWQGAEGAEQATARAVIGADGLRSLLAKSVHPVVEHQEPVRRAMYYAYYRGVPAADGPAAEFHYRGNTLVYCFPCDGDLTLLAVSVPIAQFDGFRRTPETSLARELGDMTALAPRLARAQREGPVRGTGSIPGYLRVPYGEGWALVGDAGMVMDPWSGQGIDQAATHAVSLARHLADFLDDHVDWETAMRAYHQERNEFSLKTYRRTCEFSRDLRPMTEEALRRRGLGSHG